MGLSGLLEAVLQGVVGDAVRPLFLALPVDVVFGIPRTSVEKP
jgi:hypothetical protein